MSVLLRAGYGGILPDEPKVRRRFFTPEDNIAWDNEQRQTLDIDGRPLMELLLSDEGPSPAVKRPVRKPLHSRKPEMAENGMTVTAATITGAWYEAQVDRAKTMQKSRDDKKKFILKNIRATAAQSPQSQQIGKRAATSAGFYTPPAAKASSEMDVETATRNCYTPGSVKDLEAQCNGLIRRDMLDTVFAQMQENSPLGDSMRRVVTAIHQSRSSPSPLAASKTAAKSASETFRDFKGLKTLHVATGGTKSQTQRAPQTAKFVARPASSASLHSSSTLSKSYSSNNNNNNTATDSSMFIPPPSRSGIPGKKKSESATQNGGSQTLAFADFDLGQLKNKMGLDVAKNEQHYLFGDEKTTRDSGLSKTTSGIMKMVHDPEFKSPYTYTVPEEIKTSNKNVIELLRHKLELRLPGGAGIVRKAFEMFDKDGSGKVDIAEFNDVLQALHIYIPDEQVADIHRMFDEHGTGEMDLRNFVSKCLAPDFTVDKDSTSAFLWGFPKPRYKAHAKKMKNVMSNEDILQIIREKTQERVSGGGGILRRTFNYFDKDKSGAIDIEEFAECLNAFNLLLPIARVQEIMDYCTGKQGTEEIDFYSFYDKVMGVNLKDVTHTSFFIGSGKASNHKYAKHEAIRNRFKDNNVDNEEDFVQLLETIRSKFEERFGQTGCSDTRKALQSLDLRGNGKWNRQELDAFLKRFYLKPSEEVKEAIIRCFGDESAGFVDIRKFLINILNANFHSLAEKAFEN